MNASVKFCLVEDCIRSLYRDNEVVFWSSAGFFGFFFSFFFGWWFWFLHISPAWLVTEGARALHWCSLSNSCNGTFNFCCGLKARLPGRIEKISVMKRILKFYMRFEMYIRVFWLIFSLLKSITGEVLKYDLPFPLVIWLVLDIHLLVATRWFCFHFQTGSGQVSMSLFDLPARCWSSKPGQIFISFKMCFPLR